MEERLQTEKKDTVYVDLGISRTPDCMRQMIQRDQLKMNLQTCMRGKRSIINRIRRGKRQYRSARKKWLDLIHVGFNGLVRGEA